MVINRVLINQIYRKHIFWLMIALSISALLLSACGFIGSSYNLQENDFPATQSLESQVNEVDEYVYLVEALRRQDTTVEPSGEIEQPFFDVTGQIVTLNDSDIQVFEFANEADRKAASDLISPDGSSIGTSMVTWIDQPNFWAIGKLIVLYVGHDEKTIEILYSVLGQAIAQPLQ